MCVASKTETQNWDT